MCTQPENPVSYSNPPISVRQKFLLELYDGVRVASILLRRGLPPSDHRVLRQPLTGGGVADGWSSLKRLRPPGNATATGRECHKDRRWATKMSEPRSRKNAKMRWDRRVRVRERGQRKREEQEQEVGQGNRRTKSVCPHRHSSSLNSLALVHASKGQRRPWLRGVPQERVGPAQLYSGFCEREMGRRSERKSHETDVSPVGCRP